MKDTPENFPYISRVYHQLKEGWVWDDPGSPGRLGGLLHALDGPDRSDLIVACTQLLTHEDPLVRTGVIACLPGIAADIGADVLLHLLESRPELYEGVAPVSPDPGFTMPATLAEGMLRGIAVAVTPGDSRAIAMLRSAAADQENGSWVMNDLARVDRPWLLANARGLVSHKQLSLLLPMTPDERSELIQALAPWPAEVLEGIHPAFWNQFKPEEAQRLQALMGVK